MYRHGHDIIVQNQMLLLMKIEERFDPNNPYRFIFEYEGMSEAGQPISEWRVSIEDVSTFLQQAGWAV